VPSSRDDVDAAVGYHDYALGFLLLFLVVRANSSPTSMNSATVACDAYEKIAARMAQSPTSSGTIESTGLTTKFEN
jgi:hypothetical protein